MQRAKINCVMVLCLLGSAAARADTPAVPTTEAATAPAVTSDAATMAEAMWPGEKADTPNAKARAALERNITDLSADQQPLERVINYLRESTNTNIFVNWTALQGAGVDKNTPVTVSVRDVPYRKALMTTLAYVGGGQSNLSYVIDDGVIMISTKDELGSSKYQVVRTYPIRDLIPTSAVNEEQRNNAIKDIISAITSTVAPDTWRDAHGTIGIVRELNGTLIINQTSDNQEAIRKLLVSLATDTLPVTKAYGVGDVISYGDPQQKEDKFKSLEALIVAHNSPNAWGADGKCSISEYGGKLYITAPEPMQLKIVALLDLVKKNGAAK